MNDTARLAVLTGEKLLAIGALWTRAGKTVPARFGGVSMLPSIEPGEEVLLIADATPSIGDVVAFVYRDQIAVHRLMAISRDGLSILTSGDAHRVPDAPMAAASVIGRVVHVDGSAIGVPQVLRPVVGFTRLLFRINVPLTRRFVALAARAERGVSAVLALVRR